MLESDGLRFAVTFLTGCDFVLSFLPSGSHGPGTVPSSQKFLLFFVWFWAPWSFPHGPWPALPVLELPLLTHLRDLPAGLRGLRLTESLVLNSSLHMVDRGQMGWQGGGHGCG